MAGVHPAINSGHRTGSASISQGQQHHTEENDTRKKTTHYFAVAMMFLTLTLLAMLDMTTGYGSFQGRIPNGDKIKDPCDGSVWQGVGHWAKGGRGDRNPFGEAFRQNNMVWTRDLCMADSDDDGQSNGVELGDPFCVWTLGSTPSAKPSGHPGICERWNTPDCKTRNRNRFNCESTGLQCPPVSAPGVQQIQVRMPRTTIPATDFTYMCVNVELPSDRKYHLIADTGILDNQNAVHHMILFGCSSGVTAADLQNPIGRSYPCNMLPDPNCQDIITGWQPGIPGFCHPDHIGFSVGASGVRYAALQVHWINSLKRTGMTDSSGMALYLTPNLRRYNLATFRVGDVSFSIPPKEKSFSVTANCASACTARHLLGPITVYQGFDHMHSAGKELKLTLKPQGNGQERTLWNNPFFSSQTTVFHKPDTPVQIEPRDSLHATCKYNTESRTKTTIFGYSPTDEMCFAFIQFYPAENATQTSCTSRGGLSECQLMNSNAVVDGCSTSFPTSPDLDVMKKFLKDNCNALQCLKECVNVVKAIRKHACFRTDNIRLHVETQLMQMNLLEMLAQFHSCDVEIAKEEANCPGAAASTSVKSTRCLCNKRPYLRWIH